MVSFNPLNLFKSKDDSSSSTTQNQNPVFDPQTVTMVQPASPNAPTTERVITEQPAPGEQMQMQMQLRGGGGFCCGVCAGLACFECCEICC